MSVRPPPSITRVPGSGAIAAVEMRSIKLPRTSTLDGPDRRALLPSNTRTFWNSVAPLSAAGWARLGCTGAIASASRASQAIVVLARRLIGERKSARWGRFDGAIGELL